MRVFRSYGTRLCAAKSRRNTHWQGGSVRASPLAFSPIDGQPHSNSDFPKNGEKCEMRVFRCYGARSHAASSKRNTHQQGGSARPSLLTFSLIACQPSSFSLLSSVEPSPVVTGDLCVVHCFLNPMLENHYGPGVSSCQQTWDNHLGWPDPHLPTSLRRWLYWSPPLPLRTDPQLLR